MFYLLPVFQKTILKLTAGQPQADLTTYKVHNELSFHLITKIINQDKIQSKIVFTKYENFIWMEGTEMESEKHSI